MASLTSVRPRPVGTSGRGVVPADRLHRDLRVPAELCHLPHPMIVDLLAWRGLADDERLLGRLAPRQLFADRERLLVRQHHDDPLGPQWRVVAAGPVPLAGQDRGIEAELADARPIPGSSSSVQVAATRPRRCACS